MITSAHYQENGSILVKFGDQDPISVPDNRSNRHRQMIADWQAKGNEISPYIAGDIKKRRDGEFREFMELFTDDEQLAIIGATLQSIDIKRWYDRAMGGPSFSLDHSQTEYGLTALVQAGLLTNARKKDVLAANFDG